MLCYVEVLYFSSPDQGTIKDGPLSTWMGVRWLESPFHCTCFVSIVQHKPFPQCCCFSHSKDPLPIFIESFSCVVKEMFSIED